MFFVKVENSFFCKKVENGDAKKWIFPQCRVHYVQYQYFLFYILLLWGCVRTQRTSLPTGLPTVTFPAAGPHRPLTSTKLYCLVREANGCEQLAKGCCLKVRDRESNLRPSASQVQRHFDHHATIIHCTHRKNNSSYV